MSGRWTGCHGIWASCQPSRRPAISPVSVTPVCHWGPQRSTCGRGRSLYVVRGGSGTCLVLHGVGRFPSPVNTWWMAVEWAEGRGARTHPGRWGTRLDLGRPSIDMESVPVCVCVCVRVCVCACTHASVCVCVTTHPRLLVVP